MTYIKYLTGVRMKRAALLLANPVLKVYEIGEMIGYLDQSYFTEIFKRHHGITPQDYRDRK